MRPSSLWLCPIDGWCKQIPWHCPAESWLGGLVVERSSVVETTRLPFVPLRWKKNQELVVSFLSYAASDFSKTLMPLSLFWKTFLKNIDEDYWTELNASLKGMSWSRYYSSPVFIFISVSSCNELRRIFNIGSLDGNEINLWLSAYTFYDISQILPVGTFVKNELLKCVTGSLSHPVRSH